MRDLSGLGSTVVLTLVNVATAGYPALVSQKAIALSRPAPRASFCSSCNQFSDVHLSPSWLSSGLAHAVLFGARRSGAGTVARLLHSATAARRSASFFSSLRICLLIRAGISFAPAPPRLQPACDVPASPQP
jgi:hypothetical protein